MANLLESSQTQATTAPGYYTDYLSNLASSGKAAVDPTTGAQYVGAQPLQQQAFQGVTAAGTAYQPTLAAAGTTLGQAAGSTAPLSAATPYLTAASGDVGTAAGGLMSPYIQNVVNSIGDVGQRNIQQNLAPQAMAGAVGSGQFGSKRGAEVLGQTMSNAERDILNQQYQALNSGYNTALTTALGQKQLEGTLGSTAGQLASSGQQNLTQAGQAQGQLASTNQALGLADINALSTLGGQQQTIEQNKELFPLSNLSTLSGLLRGYTTPTTTTTTAQQSPLSALGTIGAGTAGLFQGTGTSGTGASVFQQLTGGSGTSILNQIKNAIGGTTGGVNSTGTYGGNIVPTNLPADSTPQFDQSGTYIGYNNANGDFVDAGT